MTSVSEFTSFAFLRMSTPVKSPSRMSVTITWKESVSSFCTASSPVAASWTAYPDSSRDTRIPARRDSLSSTIRIASATFLPHGNLDDEVRPPPGAACKVQDPAVRMDDLLRQRKPEAGPRLLGGKEGNEDLLLDFRGHSRAIVADGNPHELLLFPRMTVDDRIRLASEPHQVAEVPGDSKRYLHPSFSLARIHRIRDDVVDRLLEQTGIPLHLEFHLFLIPGGKLHVRIKGG